MPLVLALWISCTMFLELWRYVLAASSNEEFQEYSRSEEASDQKPLKAKLTLELSRTWEICERSPVAYFCSCILSIWAWLEETSVCLFACLFVYLSICLSIANLSILYMVSIVWFLPVSVVLSILSYVSIFPSYMFYLPFISYIVHLSWLPFIFDTSSILSTISISFTWLMSICILYVLSILAISSIFYSWSRWSAVSILYCFISSI